MLTRFLTLGCVLAIALGIVVIPFPTGAVGIGLVVVLSAVFLVIFRRYTDEKSFVTTVFLVGLALRIGFGLFIYIFDLNSFFGGDGLAYDANGFALMSAWMGLIPSADAIAYQFDPASGAGWGINYLAGGIYYVLGHNMFAAQSFCAVVGAATAPMVYFCSKKIFNNGHAAKAAAIAIAVFPSFVIWSGQLLKDGRIIFLLVLAMTMVLQLQEKFSYLAVMLLTGSLFGILSLRFYIFYIAVVAVGSTFIIGLSTSGRALVRNTIILIAVGVGLTYLGVMRQASVELPTFGNLQRIQGSRESLVESANSGFGEDVDVSTTEGALSAIPLGFSYLMFAPFPWQASNIRQTITIPEVLVWWSMMPFLVIGLMYTIRNRLRKAFPVLIFSLMLTLAYSIFQGNVGTAYRQRTQIQVFLFILIGAGWTVFQEQRENKRLVSQAARRRLEDSLRARAIVNKA